MNTFVLDLFNQIITSHGEARQTCLLRLAFLIERNFGRNKHDPLHREYLPDALFNLQLTSEDRSEIISEIDSFLTGSGLSKDEKISCIFALKSLPDLHTLEVVLRFLERNYEILNERDLYSVLASFLPWSYTGDQEELARKLFEKYQTRKILEVLRNRGDADLNEEILRTLHSLDGLERR